MATYYLINTVTLNLGTGGLQKLLPGSYLDSDVVDTAAIAAAGGELVVSTDTYVAAAALVAQANHKNRGANEAEMEEVMRAASETSQAAAKAAGAGAVLVTDVAPLLGVTTQAEMNAAMKLILLGDRTYHARGVCLTNMSITAFVGVAGGTAQNGVTYVEGDYVLLPNQTTASQCGLWRVGVVAVGVAPLTRILGLTTGATYKNGCTVEVSEGTLFAGSTWKSMATGAKVVGTDDPLFYPRTCSGIITLASGTYTLGSTEGFFLFATTKSIQCTMNTPGGVLTLTNGYGANLAGRSAGKSGTAAAIIIARIDAGTIDTANNSTVDYCATNW